MGAARVITSDKRSLRAQSGFQHFAYANKNDSGTLDKSTCAALIQKRILSILSYCHCLNNLSGY